MRAGVALGSNVGDRLQNLRAARDRVSLLARDGEPLLVSSVYETDPIDCEPGAQKFMNAVVELGFEGSADELLHELRKIEAGLGRPADHARNTSRTIDLDLLYFGNEIAETAELTLPHPRIAERHFVLAPLAEIHPHLVLPLATKSVGDMLAELTGGGSVVRVSSQW